MNDTTESNVPLVPEHRAICTRRRTDPHHHQEEHVQGKKGEQYCDQCDRYCGRGGIKVVTRGGTVASRANFNDDTIYCSERCLRDRLMGARQGEDPAEDLQREVDKLRDELRAARRHRTEREGSAIETLDQIAELVSEISEARLADEIQPGDRGDQLRRSLTGMENLILREWR